MSTESLTMQFDDLGKLSYFIYTLLKLQGDDAARSSKYVPFHTTRCCSEQKSALPIAVLTPYYSEHIHFEVKL